MLQDLPADDPRRDDLQIVVDETLRCRKIVKGLLDFSRQTKPQKQAVDLNGVMERFIQERDFIPVGGTEPKHVDVRLIFATNRDLRRMVSEGSFREGLYYRLHVFPISLPSLRDRREDIPLLSSHLLTKVCERSGKHVSALSDEVLRILEQYDWPGNVRELEGAIEWAVISCDGNIVEPRHLPRSLHPQGYLGEITVPRTNEEFLKLKKILREQGIAELEREFTLASLERNNWNVTRASQEVGIARPNFQALMRKHGIRAGDRNDELRMTNKDNRYVNTIW
jgi:two-component system, NtrC family, response regulator PilR